MPARDCHHNAVRNALIHDGWTITDEDYTLLVGRQRVFIDLAAERDLITAQQGSHWIAVEVKSFVGVSAVADLRNAIGQYVMYRSVLRRAEPHYHTSRLTSKPPKQSLLNHLQSTLSKTSRYY